VVSVQLQRQEERRTVAGRHELVQLLGGEKPYREFTFERYQVTSSNRLAYERSKEFNPAAENLYLWGSCGVGKTHLAYAIARRAVEESLIVSVQRAPQLTRQVRMREPTQEQAAIDNFIAAELLVLDDLGTGLDTAFSRLILQEILDLRDFNERAGLVITSKYSLDDLAAKLGDDSIPSRIAGMCHCIRICGVDNRLKPRSDDLGAETPRPRPGQALPGI
jgi:DNA replication protein DnaC